MTTSEETGGGGADGCRNGFLHVCFITAEALMIIHRFRHFKWREGDLEKTCRRPEGLQTTLKPCRRPADESHLAVCRPEPTEP